MGAVLCVSFHLLTPFLTNQKDPDGFEILR